MNYFLKISAIIFYELLLFAVSYYIWHHQDFFDMPRNTAAIKLTQTPTPITIAKPKVVWKEIVQENSIPQFFKLEVPFTPQAPYGNWSNPWQEFCEEAVILMLTKYYKSPLPPAIIPKDEASGLLLYIMSQEEKLLGYHENTGAEDIAKILTSVFILEAKVISADLPAEASAQAGGGEETGIEKIKDEILRYRPIIIPVTGKLLKNPYFNKGGPFYHTVLVIGYDDSDNTFIVHEPGTRFGQEYKYDQQKLFNAIADWSQEEQKVIDRKMMVVIE